VLWIFSNYLEGLAMLPQYIYCYRDSENNSRLVLCYVLSMGGYRTVFGLNWASRFFFMEGYLDVSSVISGVLGCVLFADYIAFKARGKSPLSQLCISMDEELRDAQDVAIDIARSGGAPEVIDAAIQRAEGNSPNTIGKPTKEEVEMHFMSSYVDEGAWD